MRSWNVPELSAKASSAGNFQYSKAFGIRSLQQPSEPLEPETPVWMASFTKLITTIAVLQCVERGMLHIDADVTPILHELKDLEILTGFNESGEPILRQKANDITVR